MADYKTMNSEAHVIRSPERGPDDPYPVVASVVKRPGYSANAHLIAAAPDLLAACKVADGLFAYGVGGVGTDTENRNRCIKEARAIMDQILAAIAKAEGKTETADAR